MLGLEEARACGTLGVCPLSLIKVYLQNFGMSAKFGFSLLKERLTIDITKCS